MRKAMRFTFLLVLTLLACTGHRYPTQLVVADSLCAVNPDSALHLLTQYKDSVQTASKADRMYYHLLLADAMNKAYVDMSTDSILKEVADYYDRHGSANEQMRAHYLLGCAYRDMGEAPMALQCYQDAVDKADTTDMSCITLLYKIHGQMAELFNRQHLPHSCLSELAKAVSFAQKANDTLSVITYLSLKANPFHQLGMKDSFLMAKEKAAALYYKMNRPQLAAMALGSELYELIQRGEIEKARRYMRIYETQSGVFDPTGNVRKGREIYYYAKGHFFLVCSQLDSAEYYFRKELITGLSHNDQIGATIGLCQVFKQRNNNDSLAKYSQLAYQLNDSIYSEDTANHLQQMQSLYNYQRSERESAQRLHDVQKTRSLLLVLSLIVLIITIICLLIYWNHKRYQHNKEAEIREIHESFQRDKNSLKRTERLLKDLVKKNDIQYKNEIEEKKALIALLSKRISEYEHVQDRIQESHADSQLFDTPIYHRFSFLSTHVLLHPSDQEWAELEHMVERIIPEMVISIRKKYKLKKDEYHVCILVRLYFEPRAIMTLMNKDYSYVSKVRRKLLIRIFGIDGKPSDFDSRFRNLV